MKRFRLASEFNNFVNLNTMFQPAIFQLRFRSMK